MRVAYDQVNDLFLRHQKILILRPCFYVEKNCFFLAVARPAAIEWILGAILKFFIIFIAAIKIWHICIGFFDAGAHLGNKRFAQCGEWLDSLLAVVVFR